MTSSILKILATCFSWFMSPSKVKKRAEKKEEKKNEKNVKDIMSGDSDAVSTRIDKLRNKIHRRKLKNSSNKEG